MKEVLELRVNRSYSSLLFPPEEGRKISDSVLQVFLVAGDPRWANVAKVQGEVRERYGKSFFWGWSIKRSYSATELKDARLFHICIRTIFEPAGEECGTIYDESSSCAICGAGAIQQGPLWLRLRSVPKLDISITIAGEIVVSEPFADAAKRFGLKGLRLDPISFRSNRESSREKYFQLRSMEPKVGFSTMTIAGIDPFDLSEADSRQVYKCPNGHTIGLNLLSEPFVLSTPNLASRDLFETTQETGVRRGLLRPRPAYLCTPRFREMVQEEQLKGFRFEVAHIVD